MRRVIVFAVVVPLAACLQLSTGQQTGADSGPLVDAAKQDAGPTGTGCIEDAPSRVELCAALDVCPGVAFDRDALPDCGFRLNSGGVFDLECLCNGNELCPVGVASSCDQAKRLLSSQSATLVCRQVAEGRCVSLVTPDAGGGASICDKQCAGQCGGDPSCIQGCGC